MRYSSRDLGPCCKTNCMYLLTPQFCVKSIVRAILIFHVWARGVPLCPRLPEISFIIESAPLHVSLCRTWLIVINQQSARKQSGTEDIGAIRQVTALERYGNTRSLNTLVLLDWTVCSSLDQQQRLSRFWSSDQEHFTSVLIGPASAGQGDVEVIVRSVDEAKKKWWMEGYLAPMLRFLQCTSWASREDV